MRLLLDTHIFLWVITSDSHLPRDVEAVIRDPANEVFLSAVSVWEAIVKHALGKLPLPESPAVYLPAQRRAHGIATLALDEASVARLGDLPPLRKDPFDWMLVCQALEHDLVLVTADSAVRGYPVRLVPV